MSDLEAHRKRKCDCTHCFYCDNPLAKRHEHDHFPMPKRHGGEITVPACLTCHDLKDRTNLADWNPAEAILAFKEMPPTARLLTAKLLAMYSDAEKKSA